jgi:hypothetical protein
MPKQGKGKGKGKGRKRKRPLLKEYRDNAKEARGRNAASGSKLIHPKHNQAVNKQQLKNYMYGDPVAPELEVACHRVLNAMGSAANFKLKGKKAKAVFTFEVRDYDEARIFRARGADQCTPAFRLKDITDLRQGCDPVGGHLGARGPDVRRDATCDMASASEATPNCVNAFPTRRRR